MPAVKTRKWSPECLRVMQGLRDSGVPLASLALVAGVTKERVRVLLDDDTLRECGGEAN